MLIIYCLNINYMEPKFKNGIRELKVVEHSFVFFQYNCLVWMGQQKHNTGE